MIENKTDSKKYENVRDHPTTKLSYFEKMFAKYM